MTKYPESDANWYWEYEGCQFSLVLTSGLGHYCGYVRFAACPVKEHGYNGIMTYVPVHGGITYAKEDNNGMVYGFDCQHSGDRDNLELQDVGYLADECVRMALAIKAVANYEPRYFACNEDNTKKAEVIEEYHKYLGEQGISDGTFNIRNNFGAMINLLAGTL